MTTIDHISGGRAVMGIGGAWFGGEHQAFGLDFGTGFGQRLDWLAEAVAAARVLLDGGEVTSPPGGRYAFDRLRQEPLPIQRHLPIMIGGGGERKTLRIVAEYADIWNVFGLPDELAHKDEVLRAHCADVGRDPATIERTVGCKVTIRSTDAEAERRPSARSSSTTRRRSRRSRATTRSGPARPSGSPRSILDYRRAGFHTFLVEMPAPYDAETMETLIAVVKPMVDDAWAAA